MTPYRRLRHWLRRHLGVGPKLQVEYRCQDILRLGSIYGGWWVRQGLLGPVSIVYAVGVGTDISFDLGMIQQFGVTVHAFDPTPKSIAWVQAQQLPPQFVLHEIGIADYDGMARFYVPKDTDHVSHSIVRQQYVSGDTIEVKVARLTTVMRELGHDHLDVLKMDIEGAEYSVIDAILHEQIPIQQLLVEFHHRFMADGVVKTEQAVAKLRMAGYQLFAVADSGEECSFIKMD